MAIQKRSEHQRFIRKWTGVCPSGLILKTDLFEDAFGLDTIVFDLYPPGCARLVGMDIAPTTVRAACARATTQPLHGLVADLRALPIRSESLDLVVSTSTLDHFPTRAEFRLALSQICAALKPGGTLVITLDNPLNPLYGALRLASRIGWTPFPLGHTPAPWQLTRALRRHGMDVLDRGWLIHNPRVLSTVLFRILRLTAGSRAGAIIRGLLQLFAVLDRLPTRCFTACFYGLHARKCSRQDSGGS